MIAVKQDNRDVILTGVSPTTVVNPTSYDWYEEPQFSELPDPLTWDQLEQILKQDLIKQKESELVASVEQMLGTENIAHSIIMRLAIFALFLISKIAQDLAAANISTSNYDGAKFDDLNNIIETLVGKSFKPGPGTVALLGEVSNLMDDYIAWYQNLETNGVPTLNEQLFGSNS